MPNIPLYLNDDDYILFKNLNPEQQKKNKENAVKALLKTK
jgi:hypothetical protein